MDTLAAISDAIVAEFATEEDDRRPIIITRAVVVAEAMTHDGDRVLYTWSPETMTQWERVGMVTSALDTLRGIDRDDEG